MDTNDRPQGKSEWPLIKTRNPKGKVNSCLRSFSLGVTQSVSHGVRSSFTSCHDRKGVRWMERTTYGPTWSDPLWPVLIVRRSLCSYDHAHPSLTSFVPLGRDRRERPCDTSVPSALPSFVPHSVRARRAERRKERRRKGKGGRTWPRSLLRGPIQSGRLSPTSLMSTHLRSFPLML